MYTLDINNPTHVHFIGIGGSSMSGLAEILLQKGFTVTGSDSKESPVTDRLNSIGCTVSCPQSAENITDDIELAVYTAAVHDDNPELIAAKAAGIPCITRAALLGLLSLSYKCSINVSGTHGKTTTTSLITDICIAAGLDPTVSIGGVVETIGGNMRVGASDTFITEACEFTDSFLELHPTIAVILNIEADHLDYFGSLENIRKSFKKFASAIPSSGTLVINSDIDDYESFDPKNGNSFVTYGTNPEKSDYFADNIRFDKNGIATYDLYINGNLAYPVTLAIPGMHNVSNSLAAIAAASAAGADENAIKKGLLASGGAKRRLEDKGEFNGVRVIDDYAHHPDELTATLEAVRLMNSNEIWAVFQPHSFSRTHDFLEDFADTLLKYADHSVLAEIFNNREINTYGVSSSQIADLITKKGGDAAFFHTFEEIADYLKEHCRPGDIVVTLSAGDIYELADALTK